MPSGTRLSGPLALLVQLLPLWPPVPWHHPALGRRNRHTTEKARRVLGWQARPARDTILDCARSLLAHNAA